MSAAVTDPVCPTCGCTMDNGCLPGACPRWQLEAVYDHAIRQWLLTDDDGFVVDGRQIDDVR